MKQNQNDPKFYKGGKIFLISIKTAIKYYSFQKGKIDKSALIKSIKNLKDILRLRKKLYLTKVIKFNNKFYSTPIVPGFPSKAFDNMIKNGGHNFLEAGTLKKQQVDSAFLAITNKCNLNCQHCYEKHNMYNNSEVPVQKWQEIINQLQRIGTSIIILSGGEPLLEFEKLISLLKNSNKNLSDFHLHTSGSNLDYKKAALLKKCGLTAAAVGLDHYDREEHDKLRGKGSYDIAIKALQVLNDVGILTYVNICATDSLIQDDGLWRYFDLMKKLKVSIIELLEPRPFGGLYNKDIDKFLSVKNKKELFNFMKKGNEERKYKNYPLIYYVAHIEGAEQMGCMMGGLSHFYIDSKGNVNPCVFLPVTFGNIIEDDFGVIFNKMRERVPSPVHSECPSVQLSKIIKNDYTNGIRIPIPVEVIEKEWNQITD